MKRAHWRGPDWYSIGWEMWLLGLESSAVIAARMSRFGATDDASRRELELMVQEKSDAYQELQTKLTKLGSRATPEVTAMTSLRHYRAKVSANLKRLER